MSDSMTTKDLSLFVLDGAVTKLALLEEKLREWPGKKVSKSYALEEVSTINIGLKSALSYLKSE